MPTYVRTFTPRYRAKYLSAGIQHTVQIRTARDVATGTVITEGQVTLYNALNALTDRLANDFEWLSAEVCEQDVDSFTPCAIPTAVVGEADWVTDQWSPIKRCHALTFYGRASASHARISFYGFHIDSDYVVNPGADGVVSDAEFPGVAFAAGVLSEHARAGSGAPAIFYTHPTWKLNDRLLAQIRRGIITTPPGA